MRSDPEDAWHPFSAEQMIGVYRPEFLWRARMRPARFVSLYIVDTYAGNQGLLEARLFGSVRVARAFGPLVSQVQSRTDQTTVRAVASQPTARLRRGALVQAMGGPITLR